MASKGVKPRAAAYDIGYKATGASTGYTTMVQGQIYVPPGSLNLQGSKPGSDNVVMIDLDAEGDGEQVPPQQAVSHPAPAKVLSSLQRPQQPLHDEAAEPGDRVFQAQMEIRNLPKP